MSPDAPTTTMSQHEIDDLVQTLRRANAHHSRLAAESRAICRPPQKARKHAQALCLSVSVEAASRLDHKQISTVPLPFLELGPSPPPRADHVIHTTAPEIVAPIPRHPSQIGTERLPKETTRPGRPFLRCVIPSTVLLTVQDDVVSSIPDLVSKWSASTFGSEETEGESDDEDSIELDIPQPAQVGVRYAGSEDNENMDIIVSPDDDDDDRHEPFAPVHMSHPPVTIQVEPQVQPQNNQKHSSRPPLPTRIPRQAASVPQQEQGYSPQSAEAPGLAHFSSGSDSSQSSLELITPVTSEELSIIRFKRKYSLDEVEMDNEDHYMVSEKRTKYEHRGHQRTTSWPRRNV